MFAPVDGFCRGALGCPFSWPTMPEATRELMFPKWERRYAAWETAILKGRLEAGVERVRAGFPGRNAMFIETEKYGSEEWWGWQGREFTEEERAKLVSAVFTEPLPFVRADAGAQAGTDRSEVAGPNSVRVSPSGLAILAVAGRGGEVWRSALDACELRSRGSVLVSEGTAAAGTRAIQTRAYDVTDVFPRLVPNDRPLVREGGIPIGVPRSLPNRQFLSVSIVRAIDAANYPSPSEEFGDDRFAIVTSGGGGMLFVRQTPEAHERIAAALEALRSVWNEAGRVSGVLETGRPGEWMVLVNGAPLVDPAEGSLPSFLGAAGGHVAVGIMERQNYGASLSVGFVGHIFVLVGTSEEVRQGEAEIQRLRVRAIKRLQESRE